MYILFSPQSICVSCSLPVLTSACSFLLPLPSSCSLVLSLRPTDPFTPLFLSFLLSLGGTEHKRHPKTEKDPTLCFSFRPTSCCRRKRKETAPPGGQIALCKQPATSSVRPAPTRWTRVQKTVGPLPFFSLLGFPNSFFFLWSLSDRQQHHRLDGLSVYERFATFGVAGYIGTGASAPRKPRHFFFPGKPRKQ